MFRQCYNQSRCPRKVFSFDNSSSNNTNTITDTNSNNDNNKYISMALKL